MPIFLSGRCQPEDISEMAGLGRSTGRSTGRSLGQSLGHGRPIGTSKRSVKVSVSVTVSHACLLSATAPRTYFKHILTGTKENGQRPGKETGGQGGGIGGRLGGGGRVGGIDWHGCSKRRVCRHLPRVKLHPNITDFLVCPGVRNFLKP
jgi:hypothetical protein